jgi:hypothetical protein
MALQSEWTDITPALAIEYLSRAASNRHLRRSRTDAYARDMENGKWLVTGQPILFTAAGELVDGQHRLQAIIESGCTTTFLIIRGVSPAAMKVIDSGVARTFSDSLAIDGLSTGVAATLGSLTRRMALWDAGVHFQGTYGINFLTHAELRDYLDSHPELFDNAKYCTGKDAKPPSMTASTFAFLLTLFTRCDADDALEFCTRWRDGAGLSASSPILVLRDRIASGVLTHDPSFNTSKGIEVKIALAIIAWNNFRAGAEVTKLQLPKGGLAAKTYPLPK